MVLKGLHIIFVLFVCTSVHTDGKLLTTYNNKVKKEISKLYSIDKSTSLEYELLDASKNYEVYRLTSQTKDLGYLFMKEVKSCSLNGCTSGFNDQNGMGSEYFDIAVFTNPELVITEIKVLDYFSDYGYEISSSKYLKKYSGKRVCDFTKENSSVDGISGATISYNALIDSLDHFCDVVN